MPAVPVTVRSARPGDLPAVRRFGATHVYAHYAPLIGAEHARGQVTRWWDEEYLARAVAAGRLLVATVGDALVGVAQHGLAGDDHVVYKLYVHPEHRGSGIGRALLAAIEEQIPPGATRLCVEHVAANRRAGAFYEREGFVVERVEPSPTGEAALDLVWRARRRTGGPAPRP
ncbi:GNAT family N-acetyltransferase [Cellulomonas sp.]|uniref:GNAT family N-acetyltransferase n=1 Tax=Cellulomonas sp. TaxID=40001 RepID=UPI0025855C3E|nr:GNAT family N-acetyltransferase [Cellulomonas sp.]MCR6689985.1 GNAT family N-acetyltransferase [Cellulomonas sp.]